MRGFVQWLVGSFAAIAVCGAVITPTQAHAQVLVAEPTPWPTLRPAPGLDGDNYGVSMALDGDTLVVAGPDNLAVTIPVTADVFTRASATSPWIGRHRLTTSDTGLSRGVFMSVAISGNTIVIGARTSRSASNVETGAVYVFTRSGAVDSTWTQQAKIVPADAASGDRFGGSVSLLGSTLIAGADGNGLGGAAYIFRRSGSTWSQEQKLVAPDPQSGAGFGTSVALSSFGFPTPRTVAIVGAPFWNNGPAVDFGKAYAFQRVLLIDGVVWDFEQSFFGSTTLADDRFGSSVAISGNTAVIGAPRRGILDNADAGEARIFTCNSSGTVWTEQARLLSNGTSSYFGFQVAITPGRIAVAAARAPQLPDGSSRVEVFAGSGATWTRDSSVSGKGENFGSALALSGGSLIVGADRADNAAGDNVGGVHAFDLSGTSWVVQAELPPFDTGQDLFGSAVAIDGDTMIAGEPDFSRSGRAHVYRRTFWSWTQEEVLFPPIARNGDGFGEAVALFGTSVVIGAPGGGATFAGEVHLFNRVATNNWTLTQTLAATDASSVDSFGCSVALSRTSIMIVGSKDDSTGSAFQHGSVYLFKQLGDVWSQAAKLTASDLSAQDHFGASVCVQNNIAAVGAPDADGGGAVYIFTRPSGSSDVWSQVQKLTVPGQSSTGRLGSAVSIACDRLVVGADNQGGTAPNTTGAAYVFTNSGGVWGSPQPLIAPVFVGARYGASVSIDCRGRVLIGAPGNPTGSPVLAGSAHLFAPDASGVMTLRTTMGSGSSDAQEQYGQSVGIGQNHVVVGSNRTTTASGISGGLVHLHQLTELSTSVPQALPPAVPVCPQGMWELLLAVDGSGNLAYQWEFRQDPTGPWTDLGIGGLRTFPNGLSFYVSNTRNVPLTLSSASPLLPGRIGQFRCIVTAPNGYSIASTPADVLVANSCCSFSINVNGTYLQTNNSNTQPARFIPLGNCNLAPGDDVRLRTEGSYAGVGSSNLTAAIAVFSSSSTLLSPFEPLRVPGALLAAGSAPVDTVLRDIPEDFQINVQSAITVPAQAVGLFVAPNDIWFGNNQNNEPPFFLHIARCEPIGGAVSGDVTICRTGAVSLACTASGASLGYRWRYAPAATGIFNDIQDGSNTMPDGLTFIAAGSGAPTTTLTPGPPGWPEAIGQFQCNVSSACRTIQSLNSTIRVCVADYDCSGTVNVPDIFAFLSAWFANDPATDFDGSGLPVAVPDIFAFLSAWFAGCP